MLNIMPKKELLFSQIFLFKETMFLFMLKIWEYPLFTLFNPFKPTSFTLIRQIFLKYRMIPKLIRLA